MKSKLFLTIFAGILAITVSVFPNFGFANNIDELDVSEEIMQISEINEIKDYIVENAFIHLYEDPTIQNPISSKDIDLTQAIKLYQTKNIYSENGLSSEEIKNEIANSKFCYLLYVNGNNKTAEYYLQENQELSNNPELQNEKCSFDNWMVPTVRILEHEINFKLLAQESIKENHLEDYDVYFVYGATYPININAVCIKDDCEPVIIAFEEKDNSIETKLYNYSEVNEEGYKRNTIKDLNAGGLMSPVNEEQSESEQSNMLASAPALIPLIATAVCALMVFLVIILKKSKSSKA